MPHWLTSLRFRPLKQHQPPSAGEGQRVYAIGDVHGCLKELIALKALIVADNARRKPAAVTLVYVGDYVDRGPHSKGALDEVGRPLEGIVRTVHLKGNHEAMMQQFLADPRRGTGWLHNGGIQTLQSFGVDSEMARRGFDLELTRDALVAAMTPRQVEFIGTLALSYRAGDYFFCHAGVRPGVPLDEQAPEDLLWIRDTFLRSRQDFGAVVVHGHTPGNNTEVRRNRINLDTGCFASGCLTAAVLDGAEPVAFLSTTGKASA
jgi:serine/threonine protein phosphatase 1